MSRLSKILSAFALAFAVAFAAVPHASAQGTTVVTLDEGRILRDSKAGKDIQTKLASIETQINNELEPTRASLETEGKALNTQLQGKKTRAEIAADADLVAKLQAYDAKASAFAQTRQKSQQEYALTERQALINFNKALEPVVLEVVREKNAQIMMSKNSIIYGVDAIDVTSLIISKMDVASPTISVVRQKIPDQPAQ